MLFKQTGGNRKKLCRLFACDKNIVGFGLTPHGCYGVPLTVVMAF
ncbi:MAG: hypothetical protein RR846_08195 [Oscillospiraceae bacterium]